MQTIAIESVERLGALMQDILTYPELAATPRPQTIVPIEESLQIAVANLQYHIENNGAVITVGVMSRVKGDRTQLAAVFST